MNTIFKENWLPTKPLVSNDLMYGLKRVKQSKAEAYKYIETTPSTYRNMIAFDIDEGDASGQVKTLCWDDEKIPVPNWLTVNPYTGHAHAGYILKKPVGTPKGIQYLKDVRRGLNEVIGGDPAYHGGTTRNPAIHPTEWLTDRLYTIGELAEYLTKDKVNPARVSKKERFEVNGRNDQTFLSLRKFAYSAYRKANYNDEEFLHLLELYAYELYFSEIEDHDGFPLNELKSIVKSVFNWTTRTFSKEAFSKIQGARSKKRWGDRTEYNLLLQGLREIEKMTFKQIAEELGSNIGTVSSQYARLKRGKNKRLNQ
jgi:hypothetical protein